MATTPYELQVGKETTSFKFISEGTRGKIEKLILFQLVQANEEVFIYNLAFGDKNTTTDDLDDLVVTNNGDTEKVLATVVAAVVLFLHFKNQENVLVYAAGSTKSRTRLYQIGINKYYDSNKSELTILAETEDENWEHFQKGKVYRAFLVSKKMYI